MGKKTIKKYTKFSINKTNDWLPGPVMACYPIKALL